MVVNVEFLGNEPIENVITCLHYKVDKVIYFGYQDVIEKRRKSTEKFLKSHCKVGEVIFYELPQDDLRSILSTMKEVIQQEHSNDSKLFFDITGGESLILVAFGMLSRESDTPMHMFNVLSDKLVELDEGASYSISKTLEEHSIKLDLKQYIEMKGGIIKEGSQKEVKRTDDDKFLEDAEKIWQIQEKNRTVWGWFLEFLKINFVPSGDLKVERKFEKIRSKLANFRSGFRETEKLDKIIDELAKADIIRDVDRTNGKYNFRFKNKKIVECLWEAGCALELHTFLQMRKGADDCRVGVHLDWDGKERLTTDKDVCNEIDVLVLNGYIPAFVSCKTGKMDSAKSLHALYELETVAGRFGGKYAGKVLVTSNGLNSSYRERAKELGIEIRIGGDHNVC